MRLKSLLGKRVYTAPKKDFLKFQADFIKIFKNELTLTDFLLIKIFLNFNSHFNIEKKQFPVRLLRHFSYDCEMAHSSYDSEMTHSSYD